MVSFEHPKPCHTDFQDPMDKPIGPVKVNWSHPIVSNADSVLLFNKRTILPYDETGFQWETDTTKGTTPYQLQPVDKNLAFARQDIDDDGICYKSEFTIVVGPTTPFYTLMIYTLLSTPTGSNKGIYQIGNQIRDSVPVALLRSNSSSVMGYFVDGGDRFTNIPVQVGKRHILLHRFDGVNTHDFYDSAKGVWETYAGDSINQTANMYWLGTGFNNEQPVAFELHVAGFGKVPSLAACKEIVKNPYDFLEPEVQQRYFTPDAAASAGGDLLLTNRSIANFHGMRQ